MKNSSKNIKFFKKISLIVCAAVITLIFGFYNVNSMNWQSNPGTDKKFSCKFDNGKDTGWKVYGGNWTVKNGEYCAKAGPGYRSILTGTCFKNLVYEADVSSGSTGSAGLLFRISKSSERTGYYVSIDPTKDKIILMKLDDNLTEMASSAIDIKRDTMYHIKVEAKGRYIDVYVNKEHLISAVDIENTFPDEGYIGLMTSFTSAKYDNVSVYETKAFTNPVYNFSWVKGAVFVPTNAVNEIQQWDEYNQEVNDRELYYASVYGLNCVRVYLHYLVWQKDKIGLLKNIEDFLTRADKYGIKTEFVFFDDCWDSNPIIGPPYLKPLEGVHNSRWVQCPGNRIKEDYQKYKAKLKAYVQDVVKAHKDDRRVAFWEPYNEPGNGQQGLYYEITNQLLVDSRIWIRETETKIPITSTDFAGTKAKYMSDFYSWHPYDDSYSYPDKSLRGAGILVTEGMRRREKDAQTVPGIVNAYSRKGTGFIVWEAGIGRDNCRFSWGENRQSPAKSEPSVPFHGIIYPDGHPWSIEDVKSLRNDDLSSLSLFKAEYYNGDFKKLMKKSVTPLIDFDLGDENGTGSPDASAGIGKDNFSIRWTGILKPKSTGTYTIFVNSDNISRVWIDSRLIINKTLDLRKEVCGNINLTSGKNCSIKIEYVHKSGDSSMHLLWSGPGLKKQPIK